MISSLLPQGICGGQCLSSSYSAHGPPVDYSPVYSQQLAAHAVLLRVVNKAQKQAVLDVAKSSVLAYKTARSAAA
jgi:hypothetical protein